MTVIGDTIANILVHAEQANADVSISYVHDAGDGQGASLSIEVRGVDVLQRGAEGVEVRKGLVGGLG